MRVFALRVVGAAVELAIFARAQDQSAAAAGAAAGGDGVILLLAGAADVLQVLFVGFPARLNLGGLNGIADGVDLGPGEAFFLELAYDLPDLAPVNHTGLLHLDLDIGLAGECHDGHNGQRLEILQYPPQRPDMASVLQNGIVELVFVAVDVLRPVFGMLAAVNPTVVVLGLDDKDAVNGHHKVVNLGTTLRRWNGNVVEHPVLVLRQVVQLPGHHLLSHLSLRRNQPPEQEEEPDDCNDSEYEGDRFHIGLVSGWNRDYPKCYPAR